MKPVHKESHYQQPLRFLQIQLFLWLWTVRNWDCPLQSIRVSVRVYPHEPLITRAVHLRLRLHNQDVCFLTQVHPQKL